MSILDTLREKSWEPDTAQATAAAMAAPPARLDTQKLTLNIFLAVISVTFLLFMVTFISHTQYAGFQPLAGEPWKPLADTAQLWFNTALLALSSASLHGALISARRGNVTVMAVALMGAAFLAAHFVLAQLWLWREMSGLGYTFTGNPANSYFYLLTAAHGIHLLGGLVVLARAMVLLWRGATSERIIPVLTLTTRYWHYLFGLWAVLFALLASPPEVYDTIAAMCGLDG